MTTCSWCHQEFAPSRAQLQSAARGEAVYCSAACVTANMRSRSKQVPLAEVRWHCENCGCEFTLGKVQNWKQRKGETKFFCSKSCSMSYRVNKPEFLAAIRKKRAEETDRLREHMAGMRVKAATPEARAKMAQTLRERGHQPRVQGGNGRGMTRPQAMLLDALQQAQLAHVWEPELSIKTGAQKGSGYARSYKADIGCLELKLVIECDGASHAGKRRLIDAKKDACLSGLGWHVLRFSNHRILEDVDACVSEIAEVAARRAVLSVSGQER